MGGLCIPTIVVAELYAGAYKHPDPSRILVLIDALIEEMTILDFDARCARVYGRIQGRRLRDGVPAPVADLMIASVALVHNLTLVTHNTADFLEFPYLRLEDWLSS
jgi:tRNA(fMet)-specific endonuclease VapC